MQRSPRAMSPQLVLVACIAAVLAVSGCSQLVDFDRSKIPDQSGNDGGRPSDGGTGGMDAGKDAGPSMDGNMSMPDGSMSEAGAEGGTGCNSTTHAGCAADQLCCDTDSNGSFECVTTSPTQCESCGMGCNADVADVCTGRSCGCGAGSTTKCTGNTVCDTNEAKCVECRDSNDCSGNPHGEFCFAPGATATAQDNTCVACDPATSAGCDGTKPICSAAGECVACTVAAPKMCPGGQACLSSGACQCSTSADCMTPTAPICDSGTKQCRACKSAGNECTALSKDYCVDELRCSDCLPNTEAGCSGTTPDCRLNGASEYQCLACTTNTHCENLAPNDVCDTGTGSCVECGGDNDCSGAKPLCNTSTHKCVACDDASITAGTRDSRCDSKSAANTVACATSGAKKGECTACDPTDHGGCDADKLCCEGTGGVPSCEGTGFGTQCAACDTACSGANVNACNNRGCGCGAGAACAGTNDICNGGNCVDCTAAGGCTGDTLCKTTSNVCVECLGNADCREAGDDPTQTFCDTTSNVCVSCLASTDCTGDATKPICNGSGACVACSADAQCLAYGDKTCDEGSGRCVDCTGDSNCSDTPATPACNTTTHLCKQCTSTNLTKCDDSSLCTTDTCNGSNACVNTAVSTSDGVSCTTDSCAPLTGVAHTPDNSACSNTDGLACTVPTCNAVSGCSEVPSAALCDDGFACTVDSCTGSTGDGCVHVATDALCTTAGLGQCVNTGAAFECKQCDPANGNADCGAGTPTCNPATFACE